MDGRFTTERLEVEPWGDVLSSSGRLNLLSELAEILEEDVTAFLPDSLQFQKGVSDVAVWAETFSHAGNQVSSVRLDGSLAGLLILMTGSSDDRNDEMHVGYIFGKKNWGKGLATELLRGLVQKLTTDGYGGTLHAGVAHGNPASAAVLRKVGFLAIDSDNKQESNVDVFCRRFVVCKQSKGTSQML